MNKCMHESQSLCLRNSKEGRETYRQETTMQCNCCGQGALGPQKAGVISIIVLEANQTMFRLVR